METFRSKLFVANMKLNLASFRRASKDLFSVFLFIFLFNTSKALAQITPPLVTPTDLTPVINLLNDYRIEDAMQLVEKHYLDKNNSTEIAALVYLANNQSTKAEKLLKDRPFLFCEQGSAVPLEKIEDYLLSSCVSYFQLKVNIHIRNRNWNEMLVALINLKKSSKPNHENNYSLLFSYSLARKSTQTKIPFFELLERDFLSSSSLSDELRQLRDNYLIHLRRLGGEIIKENQNSAVHYLDLLFAITLTKNYIANGNTDIAINVYDSLKSAKLPFTNNVALIRSYAQEERAKKQILSAPTRP
jgi:hypothetical protein